MVNVYCFFFFKQKTAYEMRISDWSSDVCSSDLQDANGVRSSLASYSGKVIVLNFIYANCSDICPLHSERIAEIQDMVNRTPMKGLVEFISVTTEIGKECGGEECVSKCRYRGAEDN